jgi:C4-dicarboxylate-specific signal transduction histidine kinase
LRDQTPTQSLPVILLTARADEATKLSALNAGANDFLTKPFSSTELHIRIRNLIESYHYQRKLAKQNQVLECTIEQLKETESELVESEKMRSLGQLSAGMIHEINNPLNFAATGLFTLRGKAKWLPADQQNEYLDILNDAAEGVNRVKELVCRMREYSYADNSVTEEVNVSQVVNSALRLLNHEWKGKVEVVKEVPEEQHFCANKNRLIQVVLNLVQNSLDALSDKTFSEEKPTIRIESRTEGERTLLIVRDNGPGIKSEHMDKIFDPFFTTKEVGRGMGLGLSICYRIVQDYGGRIFVRSELGQFCEFRLELPLQRPQEDPAALAS